MRLISNHPGVDVAYIQAHTGFQLEVIENIQETPLPTEDVLRLLRQEIDPLGIRKLEALSGAERRQLLREIIASEASELPTGHETPRS